MTALAAAGLLGGLALPFLDTDADAAPRGAPPELGEVKWHRDFDAARAEAKRTGKPLLVLFDEVPGCQTCVRYGKSVLSHPLIQEAAETLFVPVAVYNNVGGKDRAVLKQFGEPTWNNPVVRIVGADLDGLVPRHAGDYSQAGLVAKMKSALQNAGRPVPGYLEALHTELNPRSAKTHFQMYCFWSGEVCLGKLDGVVATRAGFASGHEVVEMRYDPKRWTEARLRKAAEACGRPVDGSDFRLSASDDKYQLRHSSWRSVPMTRHQRTLVNSRLGKRLPVEDVLSPRQIALHRAAQKAGRATDYRGATDFVAAYREAERALLGS